MNGVGISYITEFVPLVFGIFAFLLLKSLSLSRAKIRLWSSFKQEETVDHSTRRVTDRHSTFYETAKDMLIVAGFLKRKNEADLEALAFSKFGLIRIEPDSIGKRNFNRVGSLKVFLYGRERIGKEIIFCSRTSGILLQYIAAGKLEVLRGNTTKIYN